MALTLSQVTSIGFKPCKKQSPFAKKYDTLIFPINKTDYLYIGYNPVIKEMNFKKIWKSFVDNDGHRMTYQITTLGETGFRELKNYVTAELNRDRMLNGQDSKEISSQV